MRNALALRRLTAMLSVHAHARYPHGRFPRGFTPLPLEDAARFLADDRPAPDEAHDVPASRRRRAVSKLAAHGLGRPGVGPAARERIVGAIRTIVEGAPQPPVTSGPSAATASVDDRVASIVERITERVTPGLQARGAGLRAAAVPEPGQATPIELEQALNDEYPALVGEPSDCWSRLAVSVPAVGQSASAWVRVEIARPLDDVRASIDPQSWDVCSAFFPAGGTYLADPGGGGYPTTNCQAGEGTPETPGSVYGWPDAKVLFEYFVTGIPGFESWFTNLLDIRTTFWPAGTVGPADAFAVSYSLRRPVCGAVLGVPQRIVIDGGSAVATSAGPGTTIVEGSKMIRFASPLVTAATKAMFEVLFDELAAQMGELACCPVTLPS
jgi:hypothetical protein